MRNKRSYIILFLAIAGCSGLLWAKTLLSAWQEASAGSGYDKLVVLHPDTVYTGGIRITFGSVCIRGQGALILLGDTSAIRTEGFFSRLDIDHCILRGGQFGLFYRDQARGEVINNTFYANWDGIRCIDSCQVTIKNNIIVNHQNYGIYYASCISGSGGVTILYNDVWANSGGNYMRLSDCSCGDESFIPAPGTGEISEDPLFVNPDQNKFILGESSPCIGTGENGSDLGAIAFALGIGAEYGRLPRRAASAYLSNQPNPFTRQTAITFRLPQTATVILKIYDVTGQLVKSLAADHSIPGQGSLEWDGRDDQGRTAPSGIYLCRMNAPGVALIRKMIRLK